MSKTIHRLFKNKPEGGTGAKRREVNGKKRRSITPSTRYEVLLEAGFSCSNPRCRHVITLEIHHILWVREGGGNDARNLIALCPNCHALHTSGNIPTKAIRHWKAILIALREGIGWRGAELLVYVYKYPDTWYSGDGVTQFAGLIARGLVVADAYDLAYMAPNEARRFRQSTHRLALTSEGRVLIEAWLEGDEDKYRELVSQPFQPAQV
jgi:hypothetical protein